MQMFHRGRAEDDEESHPQGGTLKRNDFVGFALVGLIVGFKDHGIEKECQETQHQK